VVRRTLDATMSAYLVDALAAEPSVSVRTGAEVVAATGEDQLEGVEVRDRATGTTESLPADGLFVMVGAAPRTDWLGGLAGRDQHGHLLTGSAAVSHGWPLERAPHPYETTVPRLFAVGDVRAGSVKRVASAVGEGSVVVSQLHQLLAEASRG
jgi:thioredoxin reductase (NADPH)